MAIYKKSIIIILCSLLAFSPLLKCGEFSYAESNSWIDIVNQDNEDFKKYTVGAIKAGLNFFGYRETFSYDISKAVWSWNYEKWDEIAKNAGFAGGLGEFNNKLKYRIGSNGLLQFFVTASGLQTLNDLYEAILDYYNLHEPYSKTIYSGEWFEDDDGYGCYVFQCPSSTNDYSTKQEFDLHINSGTVYRFTGQEMWINIIGDGSQQYTLNYNHNSYTYYISKFANYYNYNRYYDTVAPSSNIPSSPNTSKKVMYSEIRPAGSPNYYTTDGYLCILKSSAGNYYLGVRNNNTRGNTGEKSYYVASFSTALDMTTHNQNVTGNYQPKDNSLDNSKDTVFNTGDDDIDDFIENNNPDVTAEPVTPAPPPTDPYDNNSTGGSQDSNGDFNWQMPDINVDWDLGDFSDIFPFSIPFDIIELFNIIDAEPVTPAIYQEVDFGSFNYTIDFDLSYFDEFMEYVRAMELFLYTLTLFIATRGIFKIY